MTIPKRFRLRLQEYQGEDRAAVAHYRKLGLLQAVDCNRDRQMRFSRSIADILEGQ